VVVEGTVGNLRVLGGAVEVAEDEPSFEFDLPSQVPQQVGAIGWSSGIFRRSFFMSIDAASKEIDGS